MNMDDRYLKDCAEMLNQVRLLLQHYMENPASRSTATHRVSVSRSYRVYDFSGPPVLTVRHY